MVGNYASPYTPGSAYVLVHHVFGEANGVKGAWGHAIGGMGAITQAMAAACREAGVTISLDSPVREVSVANGRARGVVLEDGTALDASAVVSNLNPKLLFGAWSTGRTCRRVSRGAWTTGAAAPAPCG